MKKILILTALLAAEAFAQGRFYVGGSWGSAAPSGIRVEMRPPGPPRGYNNARRPMRPGRDYVWINGYNDYGRGGYVWRPGYWAPRPDRSARWVNPRWDRGQFYVGYWRR